MKKLQNSPAFSHFPKIQRSIDQCHKALHNSHEKLSGKLRELLPRIRDGTAKEEELMELLNSVSRTPIARDQLDHWLDTRRQESKQLERYINDSPQPLIVHKSDLINYRRTSLNVLAMRPTIHCDELLKFSSKLFIILCLWTRYCKFFRSRRI